jgi:hypothetical protein
VNRDAIEHAVKDGAIDQERECAACRVENGGCQECNKKVKRDAKIAALMPPWNAFAPSNPLATL